MSKQMNFYATESDKIMIAEILNSVFGNLLDIPFHKDLLFLFDYKANKRMFYLAEENRQSEIFYRIHEYYDGSVSEILDYRKTPVLEYSPASKNKEEDYYVRGRFYCCSDDREFSKKVSQFFTKLKKNFCYVKKYNVYVSRNIDLVTAKFENERIITKEDLQ
jgi:hypothetical protein